MLRHYLHFLRSKKKRWMVHHIHVVSLSCEQELDMLLVGIIPKSLLNKIPQALQTTSIKEAGYLYNDAHWLPIEPLSVEDRVVVFQSAVGEPMKSFDVKDNKSLIEEHLKSQVDVIRKTQFEDHDAIYQCIYCGKVTNRQVLKPFMKKCFCGGDYIHIQGQLDRQ